MNIKSRLSLVAVFLLVLLLLIQFVGFVSGLGLGFMIAKCQSVIGSSKKHLLLNGSTPCLMPMAKPYEEKQKITVARLVTLKIKKIITKAFQG